MAMNAKQAAELIRNGNFNDADELYDALNGQKEYGAEFARLLQHIETKVKLDMSLYTGLATSAKAVEELSAATDPLDEKDPAFADTRKRLEKVELYQTVSENGKEVSKAVEGKERDKMIAQIVAAAKLEADSELRGASSPESPAAKKFMNAADAEAKKAVYRETLNEKIDLALLQSFLVAETTKINREMDKKYSGDRKKADEEAKILLSARTKEIKEKIANIGKSGAEKLSIGVEGAIGYCAKVSAQAEERLAEYKNNVKKIADRINRGFAKLKDQGKTLRNQWQKARAGANKVFESCNKKMSDGIVAFNEGCKHVWENKYEIALSVAKNIYKNKYEIGADMVAAAGFAVVAMNCRSQSGDSNDLSDRGLLGQAGLIVRGLSEGREHLYYKDVYLDVVRLTDIIKAQPFCDKDKLFAHGGSQGGGLTVACAALCPEIVAAAPVYPFLSDYKRLYEMDLMKNAYDELGAYIRCFCPTEGEERDAMWTTLGYIDIQNFAPRIKADVLWFTGLMDNVCPPSTQYACYNKLSCKKDIVVYTNHAHEGNWRTDEAVLKFLTSYIE